MFAGLMLAAALAAVGDDAKISFTEADAKVAYASAKEFVLQCTPRDAGTVRGKLAASWILDAVSMRGADIRRDVFHADTPKGTRSFTNLMCGFRSDPDAGWVVLLSHFDTKPGSNCPGANDGASTTGLLIALASAINERGLPKGNLMMIWTDGEECMESYTDDDGFWGSKHAVASVRSNGIQVRAVICLDMLGDRDLRITIPSNGDATLSKIALHAARRAGLEDGFVRLVDDDVKDDHMPFLKAGFKAIDLIDFEYGSAPGRNDYWHTPEDTIDKISVESLHKSGRLVAEILNIIL